VKQERLPWLADNPFYTQRFAYFVGRRCRASTLQDVARELHLDWKTVKELEKQTRREQLRRIGTPGPKQSTHLHAPGNLKVSESYPLSWEKTHICASFR